MTATLRETGDKPILAVFRSDRSGRCKRVDGFLAQVLQRRRNHESFLLKNVVQEDRPDLFERFRVEEVPTLVVIEGRSVRGRLVSPRGSAEITLFLSPWLR